MSQRSLFDQAADVAPETEARVAAKPVTTELRLGRWQDALADVECDALIVDAPYSARTHGAYRAMAEVGRRSIDYGALDEAGVEEFVQSWSPRTRGWFVTLTDHTLAPTWSKALEDAGRYVFSPVACMEPGARIRLSGDGPAQWSVWAIVARPKTRAAQKWGALPGGYVVPANEGWRGGARSGVIGSKPVWLMRALIRDYTRPGDLVCDPCAGGCSTLLAARLEGRSSIGAECLPEHHAIGMKRLARGYTPSLFVGDE
jgi:site-specific DNA-methyltransferase (adenine-specific)